MRESDRVLKRDLVPLSAGNIPSAAINGAACAESTYSCIRTIRPSLNVAMMHPGMRIGVPFAALPTNTYCIANPEAGLSGKLTQRELEEFRKRGREHQDSLTAVNASLRAIRGRLAALPVAPPLLAELDVFLEHLKSASGAVARASRLGNARTMRPAAVSRKSPSAGTRGFRREGLPRRRG